MDAIECNDAKSTMSAMVGLRKLGGVQADAAGRAAGSPDSGGLSIGRRLVVMLSPQREGRPEFEEGDFRWASPRSSRGPTGRDGAGALAAVKPGMVQVVDHGVNQKEAVRRLFDAHVMVASLEEQLTEKELLIRRLSQQLSKNGLDEDKPQPEQSTKPTQPVHIEVVHEIRGGRSKAESQADKRRIAQEKANQGEAAQSGTVRNGFPKWLMADAISRQAIEKVWNMMLHDWNEKNTFEKSKVVQNLWHCGFEFAMRWGGDPNELLQEQIASLTTKLYKVQRDSLQEIAMLRQHIRKTEAQYKKLQEHCQRLRERSSATTDTALARQPSNTNLSSTGELSREQSASLLSPGAGGKRRTLGSVITPVASPSHAAALSPAAAGAPSRPVKAAVPAQSFRPDSPDGASPSLGAHDQEESGSRSRTDEVRGTGNKDMVEDDTLMVNVAEHDLEAMDHEVFESIKNLDADQQEMTISMVNDKVRRILALDPSKWTDGRLPFGLRPDNTPPDVIKLEAENKHLKGQLIEAQEALEAMRAELEAARRVKQPLEPLGNVQKFCFQKAVRNTLSLNAVGSRGREQLQQVTASNADAKNVDETQHEDEDEGNELKALRDKVAELEARLRKQQEELSKAKAQASLAQQQLAQKEKELRQKDMELKQKELELKEQTRLHEQQLAQKDAQLRAELAQKDAQLRAERSKAGTPSTRATTANSSGDGSGGAKSFWVEVDQSNGREMAGVVVSKHGGPPPALRVEGIDPNGRVAEWNRLNPGAAVAEGDLIVEINGVSGDGDALMQAFEEHGLLKMKLLRDPGSPPLDTGTAQPRITGSRTTSQALKKTSNMLHRVLAQVGEEKNIQSPTQRQVEDNLSRVNDVAETPQNRPSQSVSSRGTQGPTRPSTSGDSVQKVETLGHFENWIDELMPAPSVLEEEAEQLRQRCKAQEDEIARLVLIIDELRARMENMLSGAAATPELALHVGGLLQKVGLKEVVDAGASGASGEATLPAVFRRLYQDAVQRLQRFAIIRESVKAMNKAVLAVCEHESQGAGQGGTPPPDLEHLSATAVAALSGMWYRSDYIFKGMCDYATSQGIEALAKAQLTSLAELMSSAPSAEDTDATPLDPKPEGIHARPVCTPPKAALQRLPGRRSERFPSTSGHPLHGGLGASEGLVAKLSRGAGDRARSPRSRQHQLRQGQLADPEATSFTCYMATLKDARGDLQGGEWARANLTKEAAGERRAGSAAAPGEGGRGHRVAQGPAGPRVSAKAGLHGARSMPALPRIGAAVACP